MYKRQVYCARDLHLDCFYFGLERPTAVKRRQRLLERHLQLHDDRRCDYVELSSANLDVAGVPTASRWLGCQSFQEPVYLRSKVLQKKSRDGSIDPRDFLEFFLKQGDSPVKTLLRGLLGLRRGDIFAFYRFGNPACNTTIIASGKTDFTFGFKTDHAKSFV